MTTRHSAPHDDEHVASPVAIAEADRTRAVTS